MFSKTDNILNHILKQVIYKIKVNYGTFIGLIFFQLFGVFISLNGLSSGGDGIFNYKVITGDGILVLSFIWMVSLAATLTRKLLIDMDFVFPGNRNTSNLSNLIILFIGSAYAAVSAQLATYVMKSIMYFSYVNSEVLVGKPMITAIALFEGIYMAFLYSLMFSIVTYFIGVLCQRYKFAMAIIPVVLIIGCIPIIKINPEYISAIGKFFFWESNVGLFSIKTIGTSAIFFCMGSFVYNRLEVRR